MKKLFITLVVALMCATMSFAQSSLVATLTHEGEITTFYGSKALREAYNAAADGDIITLSSGTFSAVDINRSITLRGAGILADDEAKINPTIIEGDFGIGGNSKKAPTIEGVFCNNKIYLYALKSANFLKCRFYELYLSEQINSLSFVNCRIAALLRVSESDITTIITCTNSVIWYPEIKENYYKASFEFVNCVVYRGPWSKQNLYHCTFENSILIEAEAVAMPETNTYTNSVAVCSEGDADIFAKAASTTNSHQVAGYSNLFKTFNGTYSDTETFELTNEAKEAYKGNDNAEVGIYGGIMPYDPRPTTPRITTFNVAKKSTADGKLSVDIEVERAQ